MTCAAEISSASASSRNGIPSAAAGSAIMSELTPADHGDNWRELGHA